MDLPISKRIQHLLLILRQRKNNLTTASKFQIIADHLAIDFSNTVVLEAGRPKDLVENLDSFLGWLVEAKVLPKRERPSIERKFAGSKLRADLLKEARHLRKAIAAVIRSAISAEDLPPDSVAVINRILRKAEGYRELVPSATGFTLIYRWVWSTSESLLAPIAASMADLLSYGDCTLIRKCENPECILHFYDKTKNHTRHWCSMRSCGNRNKVQAYRERATRKAT